MIAQGILLAFFVGTFGWIGWSVFKHYRNKAHLRREWFANQAQDAIERENRKHRALIAQDARTVARMTGPEFDLRIQEWMAAK